MPNKCLLCKIRDVYPIKSHLTPAGITENTYGERDKELIYTIDPQEKRIDKYFGSQYPQNEITEVKQAPNVRKGIFCKQCEDNFGVYEHAAQPKLNEIVNSLGKGIEIKKSTTADKYVDIDIHLNILLTFFQSVVWRQCIEQILDEKDSPFSAAELEKLRVLVLANISTPIKDITKKDLSTNPKISIITTYNTKLNTTASFANPNTANTNPLIYFIGPIVLLYWLDSKPTTNFESVTRIKDSLLADELSLDKGRLSIINENVWRKVHRQLVKAVAQQYNQK